MHAERTLLNVYSEKLPSHDNLIIDFISGTFCPNKVISLGIIVKSVYFIEMWTDFVLTFLVFDKYCLQLMKLQFNER